MQPESLTIRARHCHARHNLDDIQEHAGFPHVSLINLLSATDAHWNAPKPPAHVLENLQVEFEASTP